MKKEWPEPFLSRMQSQLKEEYPDFMQAMDAAPLFSIRLHPEKGNNLFLEEQPVLWHPKGRYLKERPVFTLDPSFHAGGYYVQEASSMFIHEVLRQTLDLNKGLKVLDLCAAPGGKSTLLVSALSDDSIVVANETIRTRIPALQENLERWGYANTIASNHDPAEFEGLEGFFDVVIVDAPCSGEGLFRKDRNATAEWSVANLEICEARQKRIIAEAQKLIAEGGLLIYSTCTFNPLENEGNVNWLISSFPFELVPLDLKPEWGIAEMKSGYQFFPHRTKGEGFFVSCLRKTSKAAVRENELSSRGLEWQLLTPKQITPFSHWLKRYESLSFFKKPTGEIVAIPANILEATSSIASSLKRRSLGTEIGVMKGSDFVPSHKLAMSMLVNNDIPSIELGREDALRFLKKENLHFTGMAQGWTLARYRGLNLGWMKVLGNRTNNYLPKERKIRMDIRLEY